MFPSKKKKTGKENVVEKLEALRKIERVLKTGDIKRLIRWSTN